MQRFNGFCLSRAHRPLRCRHRWPSVSAGGASRLLYFFLQGRWRDRGLSVRRYPSWPTLPLLARTPPPWEPSRPPRLLICVGHRVSVTSSGKEVLGSSGGPALSGASRQSRCSARHPLAETDCTQTLALTSMTSSGPVPNRPGKRKRMRTSPADARDTSATAAVRLSRVVLYGRDEAQGACLGGVDCQSGGQDNVQHAPTGNGNLT